METIFNVGDTVIVKKREKNKWDYKFAFTGEMAKLSGKIFTIESIYVNRDLGEYKVPDDNALYILKEDRQRFNWSSGMLMKANEYSLKSNENVTKTLKIKMKIENAVYSSLRKQGIKI